MKLENYTPFFLKIFNLEILKVLQKEKLNIEVPETIYADLIPNFSEKFSETAVSTGISLKALFEMKENIEDIKFNQDFIETKIPVTLQNKIRKTSLEFGKIQTFFSDPAVTSIICNGPNQDLIILKNGQKQFTKIKMTAEEINELFKKISEKSHIPLIEGAINTEIDEFNISGIYSPSTGSSFIARTYK